MNGKNNKKNTMAKYIILQKVIHKAKLDSFLNSKKSPFAFDRGDFLIQL
jgi:hypothetical protein